MLTQFVRQAVARARLGLSWVRCRFFNRPAQMLAMTTCVALVVGCSPYVDPRVYPGYLRAAHAHRAQHARSSPSHHHKHHARSRAALAQPPFGGDVWDEELWSGHEPQPVVEFDEPSAGTKSIGPSQDEDASAPGGSDVDALVAPGPTPARREPAATPTIPDLLEAPDEGSPFESDELPMPEPGDAIRPSVDSANDPGLRLPSGDARGNTFGGTASDSLVLVPPANGVAEMSSTGASAFALEEPATNASPAVTGSNEPEAIERGPGHGVSFAIPTRPIDATSGFQTAASWQSAPPGADSSASPGDVTNDSHLLLEAPHNAPQQHERASAGLEAPGIDTNPMALSTSQPQYTILPNDVHANGMERWTIEATERSEADPFSDPFGDR